jgi:L-serine/L-threonine ammonia-lyase
MGADVRLKLECLQPSGSFKIRGIGFLCETLKKNGVSRFVSSSGGNAGIAVAYAGMRLKIPVTVVVPQTTTERAKKVIESFGADVRVHGASWQEAHELAENLSNNQDIALVHPFDHPLLWEGNASIIDEIYASGFLPDAVLVSVGGGGLYSGIVNGLRRNGLSSIPVIAVETEGTASLNGSIREDRLIELEQIRGVATSLGAKKVAKNAFEAAKTHPTKSIVVSDSQAISACRRLLDDHRLLVEPACGAALAPAYETLAEIKAYRKIVCIVCGGATVTGEQLQGYSV